MLTDYHLWEVEQQRIFFLCSHPEVYGTCEDQNSDDSNTDDSTANKQKKGNEGLIAWVALGKLNKK